MQHISNPDTNPTLGNAMAVGLRFELIAGVELAARRAAAADRFFRRSMTLRRPAG